MAKQVGFLDFSTRFFDLPLAGLRDFASREALPAGTEQGPSIHVGASLSRSGARHETFPVRPLRRYRRSARDQPLEFRTPLALFAIPPSMKSPCARLFASSPITAPRPRASPLFSPRGEAKCVRGASVRGARRLTNGGVRDSTLSTASKRNEVMAGLSRASTVRR